MTHTRQVFLLLVVLFVGRSFLWGKKPTYFIYLDIYTNNYNSVNVVVVVAAAKAVVLPINWIERVHCNINSLSLTCHSFRLQQGWKGFSIQIFLTEQWRCLLVWLRRSVFCCCLLKCHICFKISCTYLCVLICFLSFFHSRTLRILTSFSLVEQISVLDVLVLYCNFEYPLDRYETVWFFLSSSFHVDIFQSVIFLTISFYSFHPINTTEFQRHINAWLILIELIQFCLLIASDQDISSHLWKMRRICEI